MARKIVTHNELPQHDIKPLWPHQQQSLEFFGKNKIGFDFSSPGTGKTRVQIESYANRKDRGRMLVLAPMTLMVSAWGEDIEKYAPTLTTSFAFASQRDEALRMNTDVVIMNIDGIKWFTDKKYKERMRYLKDFDHLVIDEVSAYKHPTSLRSRAMVATRKFFKYRRALSGTPNPNSVMELFNPTLILDDGARLGTSYYALRSKVQSPTQIGPGINHLRWDDKPGVSQAIDEILSDIVIRHAFEDVMTHVPPNHREVKTFSLSPKAKRVYDTMERDCIVAFEEGTITAAHAANLRNKLLQIASGAVYASKDEYQLVDNSRYELIVDLIEERDHSVTFFNWKHQRDYLSRELEKRGISYAIIDGNVSPKARIQIVQEYQAGKLRTVLLHPQTGAHGLTLTRGTTTILSSPIYEADLLLQAIHRIYRGEQDQVTNTILVQAKGTVEDLVYARLNSKQEAMGDLLSMMAARSKR